MLLGVKTVTAFVAGLQLPPHRGSRLTPALNQAAARPGLQLHLETPWQFTMGVSTEGWGELQLWEVSSTRPGKA